MYCKNCGNDTTEMKYCSKCGTAVEEYSKNMVAEPLIYTTLDENMCKSIKVMGWILALLPLLGLITMWLPDDIFSIINPGIMGLNIGLWFADKTMLKKQGYTGKWTWWGLILLPVYLFFRCNRMNKKYGMFICSISIIALVMAVAFIPFENASQDYRMTNDIIQQTEENKKKNPYTADYQWWEDYGRSYTSTLDSGTEYLTHEVQFECNENGKRTVILYVNENRNGSKHLEFYSVVNGENYLLLVTDSFITEYSTNFDVHSWTYKWTSPKDDEITISFIAEENSLSVTSSYELFGIYGNGETPYNQMRSGTYYPIR